MTRISRLARSRETVVLAAVLVLAFTLSAYAADSDSDWKAIQEMNKSIANSRNVVAACSQFMKVYPEDKRAQEAQETIENLTWTLQGVPALIRDKGIPVADGVVINLAGALIFNGKIDLKKERSGLMAPHKAGEAPDAGTLQKRSSAILKVPVGTRLSQAMRFLGNSDDMFEQADGNDYQRVLFYALKDHKTAILWFGRADALTLVFVAATANADEENESANANADKEKESASIPKMFLGEWVESRRKSEIIIRSDSITWKREDEGEDVYLADRYKVQSGGEKIDLSATEIVNWNFATGEKLRISIDVTISIEKEKLIVAIPPSETLVSGPGFVVKSPARKLVFKRR